MNGMHTDGKKKSSLRRILIRVHLCSSVVPPQRVFPHPFCGSPRDRIFVPTCSLTRYGILTAEDAEDAEGMIWDTGSETRSCDLAMVTGAGPYADAWRPKTR